MQQRSPIPDKPVASDRVSAGDMIVMILVGALRCSCAHRSRGKHVWHGRTRGLPCMGATTKETGIILDLFALQCPFERCGGCCAWTVCFGREDVCCAGHLWLTPTLLLAVVKAPPVVCCTWKATSVLDVSSLRFSPDTGTFVSDHHGRHTPKRRAVMAVWCRHLTGDTATH